MSLLPSPLFAGTTVYNRATFKIPNFDTPKSQWPVGDPTYVVVNFWAGTAMAVDNPGGSSIQWRYGIDSEVTKSSVGVYIATFDTTGLPGLWVVEWEGSGAVAIVATNWFIVEPAY